jgi:hypothetical protein
MLMMYILTILDRKYSYPFTLEETVVNILTLLIFKASLVS